MTKIRRIVCPTDFSPTAAHAASYAASMAQAFGAELVLLHVLPEFNYPIRGLGMAGAFPHLLEQLRERARENLQQAQSGLGGVASTTELREGTPHDVILAVAKERQADLIVMGTEGHTGLTHALLGSTAERVVRLAACPVLTVRGKA
jgi:nucleotide-binding universal stress UspA family protein